MTARGIPGSGSQIVVKPPHVGQFLFGSPRLNIAPVLADQGIDLVALEQRQAAELVERHESGVDTRVFDKLQECQARLRTAEEQIPRPRLERFGHARIAAQNRPRNCLVGESLQHPQRRHANFFGLSVNCQCKYGLNAVVSRVITQHGQPFDQPRSRLASNQLRDKMPIRFVDPRFDREARHHCRISS